MTPTRRQGKNIDTRQRSFHLTDDVYAIVQERAAEAGISNSAWISNLIRDEGAAPVAAKQEPPPLTAAQLRRGMRTEIEPPAPAKNKRNIVLPDERVSTFTVQGKSVKTKTLRSDSELGGVERTPEEQRRLRDRRDRYGDIEI